MRYLNPEVGGVRVVLFARSVEAAITQAPSNSRQFGAATSSISQLFLKKTEDLMSKLADFTVGGFKVSTMRSTKVDCHCP